MIRCPYCTRFVPDAFVEDITGAGGYGIFSAPGRSGKLTACRHCLYGDEYPDDRAQEKRVAAKLDAPTPSSAPELNERSHGRWRRAFGVMLVLLGILMLLGAAWEVILLYKAFGR